MRVLEQFIFVCVVAAGITLLQLAMSYTTSISVEGKSLSPSSFRGSRLYHGNINDGSPQKIDEEMYSRQLYVVGKPAMLRMAQSSVLIVGMTGLAAEIAKCIVLAGVKSVSFIGDGKNATWGDLSTHWCLGEQSINVDLMKESLPRLQELNPYVHVRQLETRNKVENISLNSFNVVCCVDQDVATQLHIDKLARAAGCKFISASTRGAFGSIFCDFGEEHVVENVDGEELKSVLVTAMDEHGRVSVPVGETHSFSEGDVVKLIDSGGCQVPNCVEEVEGQSRLFTVSRIIGRSSFILDPPPQLHDAVRLNGHRLKEVKQPKIVRSKSLREALQSEGDELRQLLSLSSVGSNCSKLRAFSIHACFLCLDAWRGHRGGRFPTPGCRNDAMAFERMVRECPMTGGLVDEGLVHAFARGASGGLVGMTSLIGGIAAQEALKACSGLYMPFQQFLYMDCMDALPEPLPTRIECAARGDRYDGQRAVIGDTAQRMLMDRKGFVVGAGAIGCELLKCLALAGFGCHHIDGGDGAREQEDSERGEEDVQPTRGVVVTDMDTIEKSNLNRQFLYRAGDVGRFKSEVSVAAVKRMNPNLVAKALTKRVGDDVDPNRQDVPSGRTPSRKTRKTAKERTTEKTFNKEFWEVGGPNRDGTCLHGLCAMDETNLSTQSIAAYGRCFDSFG